MELTRKPSLQEKGLIDFLIKKSSLNFNEGSNDDLLVRPMEDGNMGSLLLFPNGLFNEERSFGKQISECQFIDEDGIDVIASLNVDENGNLFELDIWKTNYSPLIKIPKLM